MRTFAHQVLCTTAPLGLFAFWGGMLMAARSYPSEYDWQYMTISSLVYADRNPNGHLWASAGIALCGLAGLCWTAVLIRKGTEEGPPQGSIGIWALGLGYLCMLCCALLPKGLLRIPKSHEVLALTAFVGICVGMVHSAFKTVARRRDLPGISRLNSVILAGLVLSPIVLAALAQAYVSYARPELKWVSLAWRARGVPPYLSFAFWEWITCAVFSVYMVVLSRSTSTACRRG